MGEHGHQLFRNGERLSGQRRVFRFMIFTADFYELQFFNIAGNRCLCHLKTPSGQLFDQFFLGFDFAGRYDFQNLILPFILHVGFVLSFPMSFCGALRKN